MKILYLITALSAGGAEVSIVDLSRAMHKRHKIRAVYFRADHTYLETLRESGVDVLFMPFVRNKLIRIFVILNCIRKMVRTERFDVVHTHLPLADFIGRTACMFMKNVKIFSTIHGCDEWKQRQTPKIVITKLYNRLSVNHFPRVRLIAVSKSVKEYIKKWEHIRGDKIDVVYNFIDFNNPVKTAADFTPVFPRPEYFVAVTVARLYPGKGHEYIFKAMKRLDTPEFSRLRLVVVGDGECRGEFEEQVKQLGLYEKVVFTGRCDNVYDYLKNADLFILASESEGQSIAALEAFFCGTPALVSDIDANAELIHGSEKDNGVMFHSGDMEDLAEKIGDIYNNKYDIKRLAENAKEFSEYFSVERYIENLEGIY